MAGLRDRLAALFSPVGKRETSILSSGAGAGSVAGTTVTGKHVTADDPRIPDASRERVARLLSLAAEVEARSAHDAVFAPALIEVQQMRDQHLPQLVASYADIPPAHRAEIFRTTGRSASYGLNAALDRMIGKAEQLSRALAEEDINSFSDTLRFIDQRYGSIDPSA